MIFGECPWYDYGSGGWEFESPRAHHFSFAIDGKTRVPFDGVRALAGVPRLR